MTCVFGLLMIVWVDVFSPFSDPVSFATMSTIFEGVGTSAYLGASQFLSSASEHASNSIMTTEYVSCSSLYSARRSVAHVSALIGLKSASPSVGT